MPCNARSTRIRPRRPRVKEWPWIRSWARSVGWLYRRPTGRKYMTWYLARQTRLTRKCHWDGSICCIKWSIRSWFCCRWSSKTVWNKKEANLCTRNKTKKFSYSTGLWLFRNGWKVSTVRTSTTFISLSRKSLTPNKSTKCKCSSEKLSTKWKAWDFRQIIQFWTSTCIALPKGWISSHNWIWIKRPVPPSIKLSDKAGWPNPHPNSCATAQMTASTTPFPLQEWKGSLATKNWIKQMPSAKWPSMHS